MLHRGVAVVEVDEARAILREGAPTVFRITIENEPSKESEELAK